jgi:hypothetical protein
MLPLVVVSDALRFTSRPQHTTKFPFVAVTAAFMFTSRAASNVRVVVVGDAAQLTVSFTLMSPLPGVVEYRLVTGGAPATAPLVPVVKVLITTLFVTSRVERVAPDIFPPVAAIVKSTGSMRQVPVTPVGAAVVIFACAVTFTCAAEVSIVPPLPPLGALASNVPDSLTTPV